jgi:hypothetical protein
MYSQRTEGALASTIGRMQKGQEEVQGRSGCRVGYTNAPKSRA